MPNPACGRTEVACGVESGWKGSPELKYTRQDGALGNWMGRMTNRNRPVTHPALMRTETHVYLRVLHGGAFSSLVERSDSSRSSFLAADSLACQSTQPQASMSTGQSGRTGDRSASTPIVVTNHEPGNLYNRLLTRRLGQPASDGIVRGRRSRSSPTAGKPLTWRRAPVSAPCFAKIPKHDMGNHHA